MQKFHQNQIKIAALGVRTLRQIDASDFIIGSCYAIAVGQIKSCFVACELNGIDGHSCRNVL